MASVNVHEAKTHLSRLLDRVARGEELVIAKAGVGKLTLPEPFDRRLPARLAAQDIGTLPVLSAHALRVAGLPPLHRDPFERLIVAQALVEGLPLMGADIQLGAYRVSIVDAAK